MVLDPRQDVHISNGIFAAARPCKPVAILKANFEYTIDTLGLVEEAYGDTLELEYIVASWNGTYA